MPFFLDDTIAAIASAPGGAARGIVRISGPETAACLERRYVTSPHVDLAAVKTPAALPGELRVPALLAPLPCRLYLWPGRRSYTRQPSAEIHTIGSPPLLEAALETVCAAGARLAQPGEFTLRAFLAGRLDLTQAEAVLGVIDAQSRRELDVALAQLAGGLAGPLNDIRNQLLDLLAHLEAGLDFVEEDIEFVSAAELNLRLGAAVEAVQAAADQMAARGETPDAWRVALAGWPNTGKSSLFNALAGESAALVSATPGTTRDYVRCRVAWGQFHIELLDTAGIEPAAADQISFAAQNMTSEQLSQAHLALFCLDASRSLNDWEREQLTILGPKSSPPRMLVLTKSDLPRVLDLPLPHVAVSSVTGAGLDELRRRIDEAIAENHEETSVVAGTAIRCRESLRLAAESLSLARRAVKDRLGEELVAAELRTALEELGKVVGQVYTDDVLDRIFSRFCIGK
jgi:tRNA modification GTPase